MSVNLPRLQELLQQLIETPSVSCTHAARDQSNRPLIEKLDGWFSTLGFETHIQTVDEAAGKFNLIATTGQGEQGLVLSGHTDTVPCDEHLWRHDPFTLTEHQHRFYGLGIADMKAFFALVLESIRELDLQSLRQPLIILATADEETSMAGAKAIANGHHPVQARYAVIGEPTGLQPVRAHKGMMMLGIELTGRSGHSSDPSLGSNALEAMHRVIGNLLDWRRELQEKYHNRLFEIPVPTLNLGHIHGGDNPNRICGHCELQIDLRPLPGMSVTDLGGELHRRLHTLLKDDDIHLRIKPLFDGIEAIETPAHSELVRFVEKQTGHSAASVAFGTEAPFYQAMGMDTLVFGPGHIAQAHQPDEYLEQKSIRPCVTHLQALIRHFCL